MSIWGAVIGIVGSAVLSSRANSRSRRVGNNAMREGDRVDYLNALENQKTAAENSSILRSIGGLNAEQIMEVGAMNYDFIIQARDRNAELMRLEQAEDLRRHINEEVDAAGLIRVGYGASGISTNSGSALAVRISEMRKAEVDREYMDMVANLSIENFWLTETQRADITMREAELGAEAALFNAEAEAAVLENEAAANVRNARRNAQESGAI